MAATGKTPILLYGSTTATNQPSAGNLTNSSDGCEIAINVADKNLFFKDATNTVNAVPIRQSSASSDGWLSSTDWSTFNSKQPAGTYVTSVTGTAPVVSSGGTTPAISMAAATGSVNGYLTSTDWTTFNNKAPAVTYTSNYIPYGQGTTTPALSSSFQFDGNNVGLGGAASPWVTGVGLHAVQSANASFAGTYNFTSVMMNLYATSAGYAVKAINNGYVAAYLQSIGDGSHQWYTYPSSQTGGAAASINQSMTLFNSGGLSIGNTTDPGAANLSVSGNVVISTSGKGIDFSATPGTGTSELLADYEEGTWTPTLTFDSGSVSGSSTSGSYTKIGNQVSVTFYIDVGTSSSASGMTINGLPYTVANLNQRGVGSSQEYWNTGYTWTTVVNPNATTASISRYDFNKAIATGMRFVGTLTYFVS